MQMKCMKCDFRVEVKNVASQQSISTSKSTREANLTQKSLEHEGDSLRAIVNGTCPKCGHNKLRYYTMQLRSADEGSTVFYECVKCNFKYSENN